MHKSSRRSLRTVVRKMVHQWWGVSWGGRKGLFTNCLCSVMQLSKKLVCGFCYMPWWFIFWRGKKTQTQSFHTCLEACLLLRCMTDYWKSYQHPFSSPLCLLVPSEIVFSSIFPLPPLYCLHQNLHSIVGNLYSTKSIAILIYISLKGGVGEKRSVFFFFSSYLRQYSDLYVLILCPLPQSLCHPYFCMLHVPYLSWVGTGPG